MNPPSKKRKLGEILVAAGILDESQLRAALGEQKRWGGRLGIQLVEMGFVQEDAIVKALSEQLHMPAVDLEKVKFNPELVKTWLKVELAEKYGVFPLGITKQRALHVASADPTNMVAQQELSFHVGSGIQVSVAGARAIERAIARHYHGDMGDLGGSSSTEPEFEVMSNTGRLEPEPPARPAQPPAPAPVMAPAPAPPPVAPAQAVPTAETADLRRRMMALEKTVSSQSQAIRALLEMLLSKGMITREEYLARIQANTPKAH